jgi:hypothetical protein
MGEGIGKVVIITIYSISAMTYEVERVHGKVKVSLLSKELFRI